LDIDKNLFAQTFAAIIIIVLLVTFYILLITDVARGTQNLLTPMVLVIIAIILVSIFSVLYKIESKLEGRPKPKDHDAKKSKKGGK
jgi:uncharacterized membrane protein YbhN (UPF0104 family)